MRQHKFDKHGNTGDDILEQRGAELRVYLERDASLAFQLDEALQGSREAPEAARGAV